MNDEQARETNGAGVLVAFGRGLVKILISLVLGSGAGMLTLGIAARGQPNLWKQPDPPSEMFLAIGVGLLTAGVLMLATFRSTLSGRRKGRQEKGREDRLSV